MSRKRKKKSQPLIIFKKTKKKLQARAAACVVLLVLSRVANLAVPASYAYLVNRLASADASAHPPPGSGQSPVPTPLRSLLVPAVVAYLAALYLQGGSGGGSMGLLNNARQYAWIPISQAAARKINVDAFAHVLGMDLQYHLMRKTGELTRVLDRGSSAIQNLLSTVLFQVREKWWWFLVVLVVKRERKREREED